MAFRTVEINQPAELHVDEGQLTIQRETDTLRIPVEDISCLILNGPAIRISSLGLSILAEREVAVTVCGRDYRPAATIQPLVANARQSAVAKKQVALSQCLNDEIWKRVVQRKIENQACVLNLLGLEGAVKVGIWASDILPGDPENREGSAALTYFPLLYPGLNRRTDDPFNSLLNYGYSIVRAAIAKAIVASGMLPGFGLHHRSQLNAFNLADDLIEPFRAMVDIVAPPLLSTNVRLTKEQRHELVGVLHNACIIHGMKTSIANAIEVEVDSLRRVIETDDVDLLLLPTVLLPQKMEGVSE